MGNKDNGTPKSKLSKVTVSVPREKTTDLFHRVSIILEEARSSVARAVNHNMLVAYWLIGQEIVEELQKGDERAEYGKQVLEALSSKLNKEYGKGFSVANLKNFRQFFLTHRFRLIRYLPGSEFEGDNKSYLSGSEFQNTFSPNLSWSHLMNMFSNKKLSKLANPLTSGFLELCLLG